jgi:hypothetical protein
LKNDNVKLKGNVIRDKFDNVNPDEVNQTLGITSENSQESTGVSISALDKKAEYIVIKNSSATAVDLTGWKIVSVLGNQSFTFPAFSLAVGASVKVGDSANNSGIDFCWLDGGGTWNNSKSDPAELYDSAGKLVDVYSD